MTFVFLYDGNINFPWGMISKQPNNQCLSFPESTRLFPRLACIDGNVGTDRDIFKVLENEKEKIKYWIKKYSKRNHM